MNGSAGRAGSDGDDGWRVLVLGGGFGGLYAAAQLGRAFDLRPEDEVLLVDTRNYFTFNPLLAEVVGGALGREHVTVPFRVLARQHGFRFRQAEVRGIDPGGRTVETTAGPIRYDRCVVALGSRAQFFGNEQLRAASVPLKSVDDAERLRDRVLRMVEAAESMDPAERRKHLTFVVAGGGPAGVEVASEINHLLREVLPRYYPRAPDARVVLAEGAERILPQFDAGLARRGQRILEDAGIDLRLETLVEDASGDRVAFGDGSAVDARTLVWTAGVRAPDLLGDSGLPTNRRGAVEVDEHLRVRGREGIYAVGDAAAVRDRRRERPYPNVAPLAISQGVRAAGNVENERAGRPVEPYRAHHAGSIVTLGAGEALVDLLGLELSGAPAWIAYRAAYLFKMIGLKNKLRIGFTLGLNRLFERDLTTDATAPDLPGPAGGGPSEPARSRAG